MIVLDYIYIDWFLFESGWLFILVYRMCLGCVNKFLSLVISMNVYVYVFKMNVCGYVYVIHIYRCYILSSIFVVLGFQMLKRKFEGN